MESSERDNIRKHIQEQMRRAEEFSNAFKAKFSQCLIETVRQFYPVTDNDPELIALVENFGAHVFNSTESVIDKDNSYPDHRMADELGVMQHIVAKIPDKGQKTEFASVIHQKVKELIVDYFEAIVDMTGNGLRLLDLNSKLYSWDFVSNLHTQILKDYPQF